MIALLTGLPMTAWIGVAISVVILGLIWKAYRAGQEKERVRNLEREIETRDQIDATIDKADRARRAAGDGGLHDDDGHRRD